MPSILTDPHMLAVIAIGLLGAAPCLAGIYLMAVRWRKRTAVPYCLSAFVFYTLVFLAVVQNGLINADISPEVAGGPLLTVLIVGQALVTAVGVAIFTLLIFGAYLTFLGELEFPVKRAKAYAGAALFCIAFAAFLNPIYAARQVDSLSGRSIYQRALAEGSPELVETASRQAQQTLDALRKLGVLTEIDVTKTAIIHHVKGQFIDLPSKVVADYMRAALLQYIHCQGGMPKRVILRETGSDRDIAQLEPNGVFRRTAVAPLPQGEEPPGS